MARLDDQIVAEIPRLRRFARGLLGDTVAADDLVQDCLERALGRWHLWRATGTLRSWLFRMLYNIHLNQRRSARRRGFETDESAIDPVRAEPAAQIDRLALRDLQRALDRLSDEHRDVLLLIGMEGLSYREAADVLGVPVGTVMSRLARARARLDSLMQGCDPDNVVKLR